MRDEAQRGPVRGAPLVVVDRPAGGFGRVLVAELREQPAQLVLREQEEQHHRVRLLAQAVAVGIVALGPQDPVEPLDVAVLRAVAIPVEFLQVLVTLELADDAVAVERDEHLAAHLTPPADLLVLQADPHAQNVAPARGKEVEHLLRGLADPRHHHVRVGVVAQPTLGRVRILLVELVGAHDAVDLPAVAIRVEVRDRGPEARDLEHHLRAVVAQEVDVVSGLVVLPDVVEDRRVDVALVAAEVRLPPARQRVDVDELGLLLAVAPALPRIHRSAEAGARRRSRGPRRCAGSDTSAARA